MSRPNFYNFINVSLGIQSEMYIKIRSVETISQKTSFNSKKLYFL